jgi:hypothetical protein
VHGAVNEPDVGIAPPPQPRGRRGERAISLSFVVDDAAASTPPLFATSPRPRRRKHHRIYGREY